MKPLVLICAVLLFSCRKPAVLPAPGEPGRIVTVQADTADREIERIAEDARNSLPAFFRQLTRETEGEHSFCVKYPFPADPDSGFSAEQVWLTGIYFKNGRYYGVLAGTPRYLTGTRRGDTVTFDTEAVTDWMYVRNGTIVGGMSIKYLLETMPEHERSPADRELLRMFEW